MRATYSISLKHLYIFIATSIAYNDNITLSADRIYIPNHATLNYNISNYSSHGGARFEGRDVY